jgi:ADP-ribosylglycohydrolase
VPKILKEKIITKKREKAMHTNAAASVWGALTADALALGAHWIYDTAQIDAQIGRVDRLPDPPPNSFHTTKRAGEFTHYGDQVMVLLESLAACGAFQLEAFANDWQALFSDYAGYFDHATKNTLTNFQGGQSPRDAGSDSTELSGAARIAPLACVYDGDPEALVNAARAQTAMTHNTADVVDSAELFARALAMILEGERPLEALQTVQRAHFDRPPFDRWMAAGIASAAESTRSVIRRFGQMCDVSAGFPGVIHLVAAHPDDFHGALVANVMAGGDSAARGLLAGSLLGAGSGLDGIPVEWRKDLKRSGRIQALLDRLAATTGR